MNTFHLIEFLELKKVRLPLAILCTAFFLTSIFWLHSFQGKGFMCLGWATFLLVQMPYFYENWMKHKKSAQLFFLVMSVFILGFLAMAILIFTLAAS